MTTAEHIAALFDHDGQKFILEDQRTLEDVCREHGAIEDRATCKWNDVANEYYIEPTYDRTTDTLFRYTFPDGSAIVATFDAWDIEGDESFSWLGA